MTASREMLFEYKAFEKTEKVCLGDGRTVEAYGSGRVKIVMQLPQGKSLSTSMEAVLFVPKLACNLFSVRAAALKENIIQFGHSRCWIRNKKKTLIGMGTLTDRMYLLDCEVNLLSNRASVAQSQSSEFGTWHRRLGHLHGNQLKKMVADRLISGVSLSSAKRR
jgi:hypothetical protein